MSNIKRILPLLLLLSLFFSNCSSQESKTQQEISDKKINRSAVFAGQFYSSEKEELNQMLSKLFAEAVGSQTDDVLAIISPHAGYVYSGKVAASAFNQIDEQKEYENIFILASSHRAYYDGASIYSIGNYETPLGEVKVNMTLAKKLCKENSIFSYVPQAHFDEHSLEVQLPFLQYKLKTDFQIVPIVIGTQSKKECKKIAEILTPYFNDKNLFIISTDFSHYPDYENANKLDKQTAESIIANSPDEFLKVVEDKNNSEIDNLVTRACGWTSTLSLLYITKEMKDVEYSIVQYANSGDAAIGDKMRVVGYNAIAVSQPIRNSDTGFQLSDQDKIDLLEIARSTIESYIRTNEIPQFPPSEYSKQLLVKCGAFVTLNQNHQLRGCIGRFTATEPLYKVVQQMAIASATQDTRFIPVSEKEIDDLDIEISVLTPMQRINSIDEIELGRHGIYIKKGFQSGTFLPQVATETGWDLEEFLGHCSRDKAGIGWYGWKEAEVYIYEALVFSESEIMDE